MKTRNLHLKILVLSGLLAFPIVAFAKGEAVEKHGNEKRQVPAAQVDGSPTPSPGVTTTVPEKTETQPPPEKVNLPADHVPSKSATRVPLDKVKKPAKD